MELLQRSGDRGYPEEYLVSRIRGRGSRLVSDWDGLVFSPDPPAYLRSTEHRDNVEEGSGEGAWTSFARELKWLHNQMNNRLRNIFDPLFLYIEIETLIRSFRYKYSKKEGAEPEGILRYSLLSKRTRQVILKSNELPELLEELEKRGSLFSGSEKSMKDIFEEDGLPGLERGLRRAFLETVNDMRLHPAVRDFFAYTIDSRNMKTLIKCLRWGIRTEPYLISGGSVGLSRLRKVFRENSLPEFERIVFGLTGLRVKESSPAVIENVLHKGMAKRLRKAVIKEGNTGIILNYLWGCYMEAHDLSIVLYGSGMDAELLREELIH